MILWTSAVVLFRHRVDVWLILQSLSKPVIRLLTCLAAVVKGRIPLLAIIGGMSALIDLMPFLLPWTEARFSWLVK